MDLKAEHFERQLHSAERDKEELERKHEVWQSDQRPPTTHIPSICRRFPPCIGIPRKNSKSSLPAWRDCDPATILSFSLCKLASLTILDSICVLDDYYGQRINHICSPYIYTERNPLLVHSSWNLSDTELTQ